jgi:hypothetical protein
LADDEELFKDPDLSAAFLPSATNCQTVINVGHLIEWYRGAEEASGCSVTAVVNVADSPRAKRNSVASSTIFLGAGESPATSLPFVIMLFLQL